VKLVAKKKSTKIRITVDLSQNGYSRLQKITAATKTPIATVVRQALQLYEFVVEKTGEGHTFKTVKAGVEREITFIGYSD